MENATWQSRVRGLMLGLALGDAIGSKQSDVPRSGLLEAGVATQLAAWTTEGLLRAGTRYGGEILSRSQDTTRYAYQRWASLRGDRPADGDWFPVIDAEGQPSGRGWLMDVAVMSEPRGSSPSTMKAILSGAPTSSHGCQSLLRALPIAALAGTREYGGSDLYGHVSHYAVGNAMMTHDHSRATVAAGLAMQTLGRCLIEDESIERAVGASLPYGDARTLPLVFDAFARGRIEPCVPQVLERVAPDRSASAALAGGLYVALSFPDPDTIAEAIEFAGWAPDGDSVAAAAGAILGARHGYEALPGEWVSRLELGWVIDRLAVDLAAEVLEHQGGPSWVGDEDRRTLDPWWDTKYPGV